MEITNFVHHELLLVVGTHIDYIFGIWRILVLRLLIYSIIVPTDYRWLMFLLIPMKFCYLIILNRSTWDVYLFSDTSVLTSIEHPSWFLPKSIFISIIDLKVMFEISQSIHFNSWQPCWMRWIYWHSLFFGDASRWQISLQRWNLVKNIFILESPPYLWQLWLWLIRMNEKRAKLIKFRKFNTCDPGDHLSDSPGWWRLAIPTYSQPCILNFWESVSKSLFFVHHSLSLRVAWGCCRRRATLRIVSLWIVFKLSYP